MDELYLIMDEAMRRYFVTLGLFGYKSYEDVYKLLALFAIVDTLDLFLEYVSDVDYVSMMNSIYCLSGSTCLIDYPKYINDDSLTHDSKVNWTIRISEDNIIRVSQDGRFRTEA